MIKIIPLSHVFHKIYNEFAFASVVDTNMPILIPSSYLNFCSIMMKEV
jgi:hypothetical protein